VWAWLTLRIHPWVVSDCEFWPAECEGSQRKEGEIFLFFLGRDWVELTRKLLPGQNWLGICVRFCYERGPQVVHILNQKEVVDSQWQIQDCLFMNNKAIWSQLVQVCIEFSMRNMVDWPWKTNRQTWMGRMLCKKQRSSCLNCHESHLGCHIW
jgi:hypothetical protein